ncbi:MAG: hydroxyglutarate oxidase [Alkalinema sp. CACIAM 70d]|nr:MAG: hydroxyglutarate oxidase [Alkalinema sp. CACIAM 70d]
MYDYAIVGGGIVGLSTAMALGQRYPQAKILLLEKEAEWAHHQTGNNSGVIHSGIYYKPGSFKAKFCRDGSRSMVQFCQAHDLPHEVCGKVIVATEPEELPLLENLYQRGLQNGLPVRKITAEEVKDYEPYVACLAGIHVASTGIADYKAVCRKYAELAQQQGADLRCNTRVDRIITSNPSGIVLETSTGTFEARFLINCAGLQSDRIAQQTGATVPAKIVPFRGEYYELVPEKRHLVKGLIYPVPNPSFPFLGVHFTRMIDGTVHAGPNAVLSLKREGYHKTDFDWRDAWDTLTYGGFWKLAAKHADQGAQEVLRSLFKSLFVSSLQRLIPEVQSADLIPTHAGVRAQALQPDGKLVDDFLLIPDGAALHVCNAPSPAATSSLEIGQAIVAQIPAPASTQIPLSSC